MLPARTFHLQFDVRFWPRIAVGTLIAKRPRIEPRGPDSGTRLPPWAFDEKASVRPGMQDTRQVGIDWYFPYHLLRGFDRTDRRLPLILDEAQVLASPAHSDLAHSLRAALDIRKQTIKVVFAESSASSLRRKFGRATEPFYNWAPTEPFERLGAAFVTAMTHKVNQLSRYPLSEREALRAFEALKRTPEFSRRYSQRYMRRSPTSMSSRATPILAFSTARIWTTPPGCWKAL